VYKFALVAAVVLAAFAWYQFRKPRYISGETAPDFQVTLKDGQAAKLSDLRGKYVVLQFWGSWCGPCRAENRHLTELYKKYHEKGLEIFSVGVEQNPEAWAKAIEKDGLVWRWHTADFHSFDGDLPRQFNIRAIPATFLINPEGVINGVNLSVDQMDKILAKDQNFLN
jgi:peroxiredoxin